ncbi:hypothetical protein ACIGXU_31935, partial [Streptomyces lydicus]
MTGPTFTVAVPETPVQLQVVPAESTVAVTTLLPAGNELVVTLACPVTPVTPTPSAPLVLVKSTAAPTTGAPLQVTVAVTVTGWPAVGLAGVDVTVTRQLVAAPTFTVAVPETPTQLQVVLAETTVAVTTLAPAGNRLLVTVAWPEAL